MRVLLAVAAKPHHRDAVRQAVQRAKDSIEAAFPVESKHVRAAEWQASHGGVHMLAWTNEPEWEPLTTPDGITAIAGHHPGEGRDLTGRVTAEPGCFAVFQASERGLSASTSLAPVDPVYYARTGELHVVGNRALLVRLAAFGGIRYDLGALQSIARQGYFLSEETPFAEVRSLPPASRLVMEEQRLTITTEPLPEGESRTGSKRVAEGMLAAVEPLLRASDPVRLTLTGGRDSRLIAALLRAAGIPFHTSTSGFDDHPDVVVARQVAAALGVEHEVKAPPLTPANELSVVHPADRAQNVLRVCEGMLSAYENISGDGAYSRRPLLGGHNGEILRGGFLSGMDEVGTEDVRRRTRSLFLAHRVLFTDTANAHAEELAWRSDTPHVPDHLYLRFRVGRWHAASRAAMLRRGTPVQPFLDNRVIAAALELDPLLRRSERLVHKLIKTFAPSLAAVPLEGGQWRFKAEGRFARLRARAQGLTAKQVKPWNWRAEPGEEIATELKHTIMACARLGDLVRLDKVPELFERGRLTKPPLVWHLYTAASLLATDLTKPRPRARDRLHVRTRQDRMASSPRI
ncbi:asparagine synthase-related protein [Nonomuraea sp. CA-141351]|uniref:asparagine synthase-related protein n=1 Tax=Nonomuraea sp. CA-141351 TaxID=3239996 RepID=UPI003D8A8511